jgi:hypothetical protein
MNGRRYLTITVSYPIRGSLSARYAKKRTPTHFPGQSFFLLPLISESNREKDQPGENNPARVSLWHHREAKSYGGGPIAATKNPGK